MSDTFNEVISSAIFDPAKSAAAGMILSESCLPATFDPYFFNILPYLLWINFAAVALIHLKAEISLFKIFLLYLFPKFLAKLINLLP